MKLRKILFYENKFIVTALLVAVSIALFIGLFFSRNYALDFTISDISFVEISLAVNIALLLFLTLLIRSNLIHSTENLAKDQALKVINAIDRLKLAVTNNDDLTAIICQKLEEGLGGEFWLFLAESRVNPKAGDPYIKRAKQALDNPLPMVIHEDKHNIYFQPIVKGKRKIGILVAKVDASSGFRYLRKILPDQISSIIHNFENRIQLLEAQVSEEREQLRSLILSSISHDLKTPLSSIIGSLNIFNDLSSKNKLDAESSEALIATALEEAERLKSFISDVLEMTRIESGAIKLQKQFINSYLIIDRILKRFEAELKDYELEISLNNKIKINFDMICYEQIIQNLVENTLKYSPKQTKISIWDNLDDTYRIFIKDEGKGIHPEKLDLIFNKFERFSLEDKIVGSGLGLSIVKAVMEANNAVISAKNSECGNGAVFILEFRDFSNENHNESPQVSETFPIKNGANYD